MTVPISIKLVSLGVSGGAGAAAGLYYGGFSTAQTWAALMTNLTSFIIDRTEGHADKNFFTRKAQKIALDAICMIAILYSGRMISGLQEQKFELAEKYCQHWSKNPQCMNLAFESLAYSVGQLSVLYNTIIALGEIVIHIKTN
ncbi:MAG: hypothetical protein P0S96_01465 [Simkaniaceae bacterium]|nr:hypothetical protein [Candidatus Sacchlamyda saccharinae]